MTVGKLMIVLVAGGLWIWFTVSAIRSAVIEGSMDMSRHLKKNHNDVEATIWYVWVLIHVCLCVAVFIATIISMWDKPLNDIL